ncbi:MAG: 2-C-methyl-D-erythritol 2,4-cyclodiphosphate synthase, partial [Clostridia bacterium]|nr:2-C-methyl-D-erythritol 2,4-cyclodiphosphate synthase [Clostridia bacterium]
MRSMRRSTPIREKRIMRSNIADALGIAVGQVGVKATTTEGLGFAGTKEG